MTLLDRYLLLRFVATTVKTAVALAVLYSVIDLLAERRDVIMDYDVPWTVTAEYYAALLPTLLYQVTPIAVLTAGLMVFGDAAQNNEILAALAGGVSLRRLAAGPLIAAAGFGVGLFAMHNAFGAESYGKARALDGEYFSQTSERKREGVSWPALEGGWTCHVLTFNRLANSGEGVYMYALREDGNEYIAAKRIYWEPERGVWLIESGWWSVFAADWSRRLSQERITQREAPFRETPETLFALDEPADTKDLEDLAADIARAQGQGRETAAFWVGYHAKYSYPALCFVMALLAVPFAMRLRRGGLAISFGASVVLALAYLVFYGICLKFGEIGAMPALVAAWLANVTFAAGGLILFYRTPT